MVGLLVLSLSQAVAASPGSLPEAARAFLAEYEPGAAKLEAYYRKMRIRAHIRTLSPKGERIRLVEYMGNGRLLRLLEADELFDGKRPDSGTTVSVSNPECSFRLTKRPDSDAYIITGKTRGYADISRAIQFADVPFSAFCWRDIRIARFFREPTVSIGKVEDVVIDGERLKRVDWTESFPPKEGKERAPWHGWFLFNPVQHWVLRAHHLGRDETWIEYSTGPDRMPLLRRIESWKNEDSGKRSWVTTTEVEQIVPGEVPEQEFSLAAFGLPDVPESKSYTVRYLVLFGILGLALALALRWAAYRRATARA